MKRNILLGLLLAMPAWGGLTLDLIPSGGAVSGSPGGTVGWGFTLTADDASFYVISGVELCIGAQFSPCPADTPGLGTFQEYIATNFLIIGASPFGHDSPYSEDFQQGAPGLGIGEFLIAASAAPQVVNGVINLTFDVYSDDTFSELLPGVTVTQAVQINIEAAEVAPSVPEPRLGLLVGCGLLVFATRRHRAYFR